MQCQACHWSGRPGCGHFRGWPPRSGRRRRTRRRQQGCGLPQRHGQARRWGGRPGCGHCRGLPPRCARRGRTRRRRLGRTAHRPRVRLNQRRMRTYRWGGRQGCGCCRRQPRRSGRRRRTRRRRLDGIAPTRPYAAQTQGIVCRWGGRPGCGRRPGHHRSRCCRPPRSSRQGRRRQQLCRQTTPTRPHVTQRHVTKCRWGGRPGCGRCRRHLPRSGRRGETRRRRLWLGTARRLRRRIQ